MGKNLHVLGMYNVKFNQTNTYLLQVLVWWSGAGLSTVLAHPSLPHPLLAWADGFILCFLGSYKLGEYIMKLKWPKTSPNKIHKLTKSSDKPTPTTTYNEMTKRAYSVVKNRLLVCLSGI